MTDPIHQHTFENGRCRVCGITEKNYNDLRPFQTCHPITAAELERQLMELKKRMEELSRPSFFEIVTFALAVNIWIIVLLK